MHYLRLIVAVVVLLGLSGCADGLRFSAEGTHIIETDDLPQSTIMPPWPPPEVPPFQ